MPSMPKSKYGGETKNSKNWLANPEDEKLYNSRRWRNFRLSYLKKHPVCAKCTQPAKYLDHIKPISQGGEIWDLRNLQSLCPSCNGRKTRLQ